MCPPNVLQSDMRVPLWGPMKYAAKLRSMQVGADGCVGGCSQAEEHAGGGKGVQVGAAALSATALAAQSD